MICSSAPCRNTIWFTKKSVTPYAFPVGSALSSTYFFKFALRFFEIGNGPSRSIPTFWNGLSTLIHCRKPVGLSGIPFLSWQEVQLWIWCDIHYQPRPKKTVLQFLFPHVYSPCDSRQYRRDTLWGVVHGRRQERKDVGTVCSEKIAPALDHPNEMPTYRIFSPLFSDRLTT